MRIMNNEMTAAQRRAAPAGNGNNGFRYLSRACAILLVFAEIAMLGRSAFDPKRTCSGLGGSVIYIDVIWHHNDPAYPVRLVSELDESRWECRKLEFYRDGRVGAASKTGATLDTALGLEPVPSIVEINQDREFTAKSMDPSAFHALWSEQGLN